jgi:hypothetical protein
MEGARANWLHHVEPAVGAHELTPGYSRGLSMWTTLAPGLQCNWRGDQKPKPGVIRITRDQGATQHPAKLSQVEALLTGTTLEVDGWKANGG